MICKKKLVKFIPYKMLNLECCFRYSQWMWRSVFIVIRRRWSLYWRHHWRYDVFRGTCSVPHAWLCRRPGPTKDRDGQRASNCCTSYLSQFDRDTRPERILDCTIKVRLVLGIRYNHTVFCVFLYFYCRILKLFDNIKIYLNASI